MYVTSINTQFDSHKYVIQHAQTVTIKGEAQTTATASTTGLLHAQRGLDASNKSMLL